MLRRAAAAGVWGVLAGCVSSTPVTVTSPAVRSDTHRPDTVACPLRVVEIVDDRMDPQVLGQVGPRTVRAPADSDAWLRGVLSALPQFGVAVGFGEQAAAPARAIDARAELKTAWVASVTTAKTASVVLNVQYLRSGVLLKTADYRGSVSRANWNSGTGEIQGMLDDAFAQVLQQVTSDVRALCAQGGTSS